jgi:hypothetical protein
MPLTVREVDPEKERETLLALLEANLPVLDHRRRFSWLYRDNPAGPAWSWEVLDGAAARAVGVASVFPRMMWVGGALQRCGQVGDFAVAPTHRTLGPAVALQRATLGLVDDGLVALCYDCPPHDAGLSTFRRLGLDVTRRTVRHARLLRTDRQVTRRLGRGPHAALVSAVANAALAASRRRPRPPRGVELAGFAGPFGEEFTALDRRLVPAGIASRRSADDLNWRYRADPLHRYEVITARRGGELLGFTVFTAAGGDAQVVDLFGDVDDLAVSLLDAVAQRAAASGTETLQLIAAEGDAALGPRLGSAGFRPRSSGPSVVAHAPAGSPAARLFVRPDGWLLRQADLSA